MDHKVLKCMCMKITTGYPKKVVVVVVVDWWW